MTATWHTQPMASADTETSGVSIEEDRVLTAAVLEIDPSAGSVVTQSWVLDPGIDVPASAAEIHGYTTERIRAEGRKDVDAAIHEICESILASVYAGLPLVVYNAPFDISLLDRESRRCGMEPFGDRVAAACAVVIDPYCLDKKVDPYRKGKRTLTAMSAHYGVPIGDAAHGCEADALVSARVAYRIAQRNPRIAAMPLHELHELQVRAKAEQAASFRQYLAKQGKPHGDVRDEWPLIPYQPAEVLA
ncbi:exonuclease domain-containing protein [Nonomuraea sp. NPDC050394]|uniref:exonuclease domain-containing protein n=1 Tax=Nonomuraea sp. NPDC050394 TaxID=3364363 RepID=UPI00378CFB99